MDNLSEFPAKVSEIITDSLGSFGTSADPEDWDAESKDASSAVHFDAVEFDLPQLIEVSLFHWCCFK